MKKEKYFVLICTLLLTTALGAQAPNEKVQHDKKYYVSKEGKLYWQAEMPVYLFVSDSEDGKSMKRLESESSKQFTNPLFLDTEGVNFIRTKWAVNPETKQPITPQQEILFEIYRDGTAPASIVKFNGAKRYRSNTGIYYGKDLSINVKSNDRLSGLEKVFFSKNDAPYSDYTSDIAINQDGKYTYKFYGLDNVGNAESPKSYEFTVDVTSPTTNFQVEGDKQDNILSPRTKIKLSANDASSGVSITYFKIDDQEPRRFYTTINLTNVKEGDHTLTYYSVDNVGNQETEKTYNFYMDRTSPKVEATVVGDQYQNRGRVFVSTRTKVKLNASDNKAGVQKIWYRVDSGDETVYTEPFELPRDNGKHTVTFFATDNVNNNFKLLFDRNASGRESLDIDIEAPTIEYGFTGKQYVSRDTAFITSKTEIGLFAKDSDSGIKDIGYKINGGSGQMYDKPIMLQEEGFYQVDFYGTDQVNNRNRKEFFFIVDNTGPEIENILSMEPVGTIDLDDMNESVNVYSKGVKIFLAATDKVVDADKIYYKLNGGTERLYTAPITLNTKGLAEIEVRAIDKLGNETLAEKKSLFIK